MVMVMVGKEDNKGSRGERGLREGLYLLILPDQNMQNSFHHSLIMMKAMLKMLTRAAHKEALDTFRSPFKFCPYLERTYHFGLNDEFWSYFLFRNNCYDLRKNTSSIMKMTTMVMREGWVGGVRGFGKSQFFMPSLQSP